MTAVLGFFAIFSMGLLAPANVQASTDLDLSALTRSLEALGVRAPGSLVRAVDAFSKKRNVEASMHLKANLLAHGVINSAHGHAMVEALQTAVAAQGSNAVELVEDKESRTPLDQSSR